MRVRSNHCGCARFNRSTCVAAMTTLRPMLVFFSPVRRQKDSIDGLLISKSREFAHDRLAIPVAQQYLTRSVGQTVRHFGACNPGCCEAFAFYDPTPVTEGRRAVAYVLLARACEGKASFCHVVGGACNPDCPTIQRMVVCCRDNIEPNLLQSVYH